MEQATTTNIQRPSLKIGITYRELGVFLLLVFLNLKFAAITIVQDRSIVIDAIVYLLLVITFNYSNWTYKSLTITAILTVVYTLINFSSYKLNVLMPLLVIQSVSGISFKRYLAINFIITGFTLLLMYCIYGEGKIMYGFSFLIDRKERMSFGFGHPNSAGLYYYCFMVNGLLLLYFSKFQKHIPLYMIAIVPLWMYIYQKTASRSFLLSIVALYGCYFYYYLSLRLNKKSLFRQTSYLYIFLPLIFTGLTLFFSFQRENFVILDRLLSKRLTFYEIFLNQITPMDFFFGSDVYKTLVIDSSYIHLLFEGGIFFFIGFCIFYVISAIRMVNKKDWVPISVVASFMAYGLMETTLLFTMLIGTNILWVMLYFYYKHGRIQMS